MNVHVHVICEISGRGRPLTLYIVYVARIFLRAARDVTTTLLF
jgi:hypothetical protein